MLVVGAGFTGLSAAMELAASGRQVVVVDAAEPGDGASGRNGGQLHAGQRVSQTYLAAKLGRATADRLWQLAVEAEAHIHTLRARLGADCAFRPGLIHPAHSRTSLRELHEDADTLADWYGVASTRLGREELSAAIGSHHYVGGVRDTRGGHLNPLALVRALLRGAIAAGAMVVGGAKVTGLEGTGPRRVTVAGRHLMADNVILAGNGMMAGLERAADARIVPLANYIAATAPLPTRLIPGEEAVSDTRWVIRYWREDASGRLIFGGGETFGQPPRDVAAFVRPYLTQTYPQLANIPIEAAWSGTLAITSTRCPLIKRLASGLYVAAGFSGQGVALAPFAGKVVAEAVLGDTERLDVFASMPVPPLPGGRYVMAPLAALAMAWFALRDRLGV